jgi:D-alanine-D-alanine ligase
MQFGSTMEYENATEMRALESRIDRLKSRLRLGIIFGGNKNAAGSVVFRSQNARSWKSYEAVAQDIADALRRQGFRHVDLMSDDMRLGDRLRRGGIHMAWLNTGGVQGYNPTAHAPSMLEMMGIPYVGHDPLAATLLDNKHAFKRGAVSAGLPTPAFTTWHSARGPFRPELNSLFKRAFAGYSGPFVVKPVSGRASLHVHVVPDASGLSEAVADVYAVSGDAVLIEQYLAGREFVIAVTGPVVSKRGTLERCAGPLAFAALERVLTDDEQIFTSMDHKPITNDRLRPVDPVRDRALLETMKRLAHETYLEFNLCSIIRLDLRADADGNLFILEANPKPDLKKPAAGVTSLISAGLPAGMGYDDLIMSLFADRLQFLLTHRPSAVQHLVELMETPSLFDLMDGPDSAGARLPPAADLVGKVNDFAADLNVLALQATLRASYGEHETPGQSVTKADERAA